MLFETRYFWAVFTSRNPETTGRLKALFDRARHAYASSISVYEVYKQTLANEGKTVARLRANTIKRDFDVIDVDSQIAEEGAEMSHKLRIPMADSLIMATASRFNLSCVTDDPHFSEVRRVWV
ncbi:MAG: PIN domain-containing protein [Thaumarchaeota archaeon]|nr:PIN domain-containing protein [Nitrososphaerota archaeon]